MEVILCTKHRKPCYLKTGTKLGSSQGQSFYICSLSEGRCDFVLKTSLPASRCPMHPDTIIGLQAITTSSSKRQYFRCKAKEPDNSWCGHRPLTNEGPKVIPLEDHNFRSINKTKENTEQNVLHKCSPQVEENLSIQLKNKLKIQEKSIEKPEKKNSTRDHGSIGADSATNEAHQAATGADNTTTAENVKIVQQRDSTNTENNTDTVTTATSAEYRHKARSDQTNVHPVNVSTQRDNVINKTCSKECDPVALNQQPRLLRDPQTIRDELARNLDKKKGIMAAVKLSSLPDNGEKLRRQVEEIQRAIAGLDLKIAKDQRELKLARDQRDAESVKAAHTVSAGQRAPQIVRVYPPDQARTQLIPANKSDKQFIPASQVQKLSSAQHPGVTTVVLPSSQPSSDHTKISFTQHAGMSKIVLPGNQSSQQYQGSQFSLPRSTVPDGNHLAHDSQGLRQTKMLEHAVQIPPHILQQMYAANPQAMSLYGGRMTAARLQEVGSVTKDAIEKLHRQLESCPSATTELPDPEGLTVSLMTHQRQALAWLQWREKQHPSGGILADDMGLGKTLTMISLILKSKVHGKEEEKSSWLSREKQLEKLDKSIVKSDATLVICPASLIHQWNKEIERRCRPHLLKVLLYHGPNREKDILRVASHDVVITTYNIISKEVGPPVDPKSAERPATDENDISKEDDGSGKNQPNILRIGWERIILDEAHSIKNHKSLTSMAVCRLRSAFRWAMTGTPIQNDLLDMYALLRFLRCSPFDEFKVWKRQVDTKNSTGTARLNTLVKSLLLRRTKSQSEQGGSPLVPLPSRTCETVVLKLSDEERVIYEKVFKRSKSTFQNYLQRHKEKGDLSKPMTDKTTMNPFKDNVHSDTNPRSSSPTTVSQGAAMGNQTGHQGSAGILVLLLRLRQCCSHLSLMKESLDDEVIESEGVELSLVEQMTGLLLGDTATSDELKVSKSSPLFSPSSVSTKIKALMDKLQEIKKGTEKGQISKSVIVSQWTQMLSIVGYHLKRYGIKYSIIQGSIPPKKRMEYVDDFNINPQGAEVMLVSLRAGGVGLNLIGGNHLFLLDNHWNPALEDQACDRIYRMGQEKDVFIYRFICKDTVEEKIVELQKRKTSMANDILSGAAASSQKLTLADLRSLFGV